MCKCLGPAQETKGESKIALNDLSNTNAIGQTLKHNSSRYPMKRPDRNASV